MNIKRFSILLALAFVIVLSGCNLPNVHLGKVSVGEIRLGMVGSNLPGQISYQFGTFTGFENSSFSVEEGQTILLDYQIELQKGSLKLVLEGPEGETIWETMLEADDSDQVEIAIEETGRYEIFVQAEKAGGSFDVTWEIE